VATASITVNRIIETDIGAVVVRDDASGRGFIENLERRFRRLADPLDRMAEPGIRRILNIPHL
jgi:hypothetical protein